MSDRSGNSYTQTTMLLRRMVRAKPVGNFEDLFHDHWVLKSYLFSCLENDEISGWISAILYDAI